MIIPLLSLALIALGITLMIVTLIMQQVTGELSPAAPAFPMEQSQYFGNTWVHPPPIPYALQEQAIIIMTGCELIQCCAVTFYPD